MRARGRAASERPFGPRGPLDDDVDEPPGHDDRLADLLAVQVRLHPRRSERALDQLLLRVARPRPRRGRAPCRSPGSRARTSPARAATRRRPATAAPTTARGPAPPRAPRRRAARTAGSARPPSRPRSARPAPTSPAHSSFTSSITAAIAVLNDSRRPMSSVTFAIVSCALRVSAPPPSERVPGLGSLTARSATAAGRSVPSPRTPSSVKSMSWSAGPTKSMPVAPRPRRSMSTNCVRRRHVPACDFDIFAPPWRTHPCRGTSARTARGTPTIPSSFSDLREETRVEQVPGRVVDPALVLVDRHPVSRPARASNGASSFAGSQ